MPNPHGSFIWYELMTSGAAAAGDFYSAVVGWTFGDKMPGDIDYRGIVRSDGGNAGGVLQIDDNMRSHGARPVWLGYIGVDDVDATVAAVEGDGGKVLMPAWDVPNVGRLAMVADPQGAPFYLMRGASEQSSDVFSVDQPQHVRWNELSTTDSDGAVAFYSRNFGWKQEGDMDMGKLGKYRFFQHGGVMIGAVMPKMPQMPVPMWTYYIGVDDIDRAASAMTAGGGQMVQEPIEIPGGEYSLVGIDPQGAAFGLVGPRIS